MSLFTRLRLRSHVRLFLIFICTFIIPLVILTTIFLYSYRNSYNNQIQQATSSEMDSVSTNINTQYQIAATYISTIAQDPALLEHLKQSVYPSHSPSPALAPLDEIIHRYNTGVPPRLFCQIIIISANNEVLYGQEAIGSLKDSQDFLDRVRNSYVSPLNNTVWFSDHDIRVSATNSSYIYAVRTIIDSTTWRPIGHILLRFRSSDLISMYLHSSNDSRSIFVLNELGEVVSLIDNLDVHSSIISPNKQMFLLSTSPLEVDDMTIYINKFSNQWHLVTVSKPSLETSPQLGLSVALYVLALMFCVALTLVVSYIMSKRFMKPVNLLISRMQEVESGNLHSRAVINTHDEFEALANSYNHMIERIETLMRQIIFEQEEKRKSDIQMLQAQINPHFLYNTLASVRYMIYTKPPEEVDKLLLALSRFLKYVLSNADNVYVTLDREFEQLENYITIQQFGFDVPLQYKVEIEPGLGHCLVVKMLFQPLIENAILHGLKLNKDDPTLHIKVSTTPDDMVEINISDNGAGFDPATLSDKPNNASSTVKPSHHLGIKNVRQRLWLHYGESYRFEINSTKGVGTSILIQTPKLTVEDIRDENTNRG